jgi:hypothetical protein
MNLYSYVGNRPTYFTDPWGLVSNNKTWGEKFGTGLLDALLGALEKATDFSVFRQSYNPDTGIPIPGYHQEYPFYNVGKLANKLSPGIAVGTTIVEIYDIWNRDSCDKGNSFGKKLAKSLIAGSVNFGSYVAGSAVMAGLSSTPGGVIAGFFVAGAVGIGANWLKGRLYNYID